MQLCDFGLARKLSDISITPSSQVSSPNKLWVDPCINFIKSKDHFLSKSPCPIFFFKSSFCYLLFTCVFSCHKQNVEPHVTWLLNYFWMEGSIPMLLISGLLVVSYMSVILGDLHLLGRNSLNWQNRSFQIQTQFFLAPRALPLLT